VPHHPPDVRPHELLRGGVPTLVCVNLISCIT